MSPVSSVIFFVLSKLLHRRSDIDTPKRDSRLMVWSLRACDNSDSRPTQMVSFLPSLSPSSPFPPFQSNRSFPCSVAATYSYDELWLIWMARRWQQQPESIFIERRKINSKEMDFFCRAHSSALLTQPTTPWVEYFDTNATKIYGTNSMNPLK